MLAAFSLFKYDFLADLFKIPHFSWDRVVLVFPCLTFQFLYCTSDTSSCHKWQDFFCKKLNISLYTCACAQTEIHTISKLDLKEERDWDVDQRGQTANI